MLKALISDNNLKLIGSGANSKVYRYYDIKRTYGLDSIIIKSCNNHNVDNNIRNYNLIKKYLNTTIFLEECILDNNKALVTEDLSCDDYIYISPNSRFINSQEKRFISAGLKKEEDYFQSEAEQYISNNKKCSILNFDEVINNLITELSIISNERINLFFDCYFWGMEKDKKDITLLYKIADWDNITKVPDNVEPDVEFYKANLLELKSSLSQFIKEFIIPSNIDTYIKTINKILQI